MERASEFFDNLPRWIKVLGGITLSGFVIALTRRGLKAKKIKNNPKDVVILHQIGRGPHVPSLTPYAIKLETYLRMANIEYQNVHSFDLSPKGKVPWIEYNDTVMGDTELIIQFLNEKKGLDLNSHLTPEEWATGRALLKLNEESLYWTLGLHRWKYTGAQKIVRTFQGLSYFTYYMISRNCQKAAYMQGIGRHSEEEVYHIMRQDFQAISVFLGNKKFLFGDNPCQYDCSIFGMLAETRWASSGKSEEILKEFDNLCRYCDRMKETFWPDWDDCTTRGGTMLAIR